MGADTLRPWPRPAALQASTKLTAPAWLANSRPAAAPRDKAHGPQGDSGIGGRGTPTLTPRHATRPPQVRSLAQPRQAEHTRLLGAGFRGPRAERSQGVRPRSRPRGRRNGAPGVLRAVPHVAHSPVLTFFFLPSVPSRLKNESSVFILRARAVGERGDAADMGPRGAARVAGLRSPPAGSGRRAPPRLLCACPLRRSRPKTQTWEIPQGRGCVPSLPQHIAPLGRTGPRHGQPGTAQMRDSLQASRWAWGTPRDPHVQNRAGQGATLPQPYPKQKQI